VDSNLNIYPGLFTLFVSYFGGFFSGFGCFGGSGFILFSFGFFDF